jgi:tungstate transport system substrate-binding protein
MRKEEQIIAAIVVIGVVIASTGIIIYLDQTRGKETLVISTTTSLYDTGLLDKIKETYESVNTHIILAFISAGTGIALENARNGDADMILVHSPSQEFPFMNASYGVNRKIFAYNFFTIVGPADDPAGINGTTPTVALQKILQYGRLHNTTIWVSRDDLSGTNTKEISLWSQAGYNYTEIRDEAWFVSSGSGMGTTLNMANQLNLYTLSDIGTYLKYSSGGLISLKQLIAEGQNLLNVYSAIAVNSTTVPSVKFQESMEFIQWIVSSSGQDIIANYGVSDYGQPLFFPAVSIVQSGQPTQIYQWIRSYAFYNYEGTLYECPPVWREGNYGLYP